MKDGKLVSVFFPSQSVAVPGRDYQILISVLGTGSAAGLAIWGVSEPALSIIAASIPMMRVFFFDRPRTGSDSPYGMDGNPTSLGAQSKPTMKNKDDLESFDDDLE